MRPCGRTRRRLGAHRLGQQLPQVGQRERLGQGAEHAQAAVERQPLGRPQDPLVDPAGHDDPGLALSVGEKADDIDPVEIGHDQIHHDDVDVIGVLIGEGRVVGRDHHLVSGPLRHEAEQFPEIRIIVDHKQAAAHIESRGRLGQIHQFPS